MDVIVWSVRIWLYGVYGCGWMDCMDLLIDWYPFISYHVIHSYYRRVHGCNGNEWNCVFYRQKKSRESMEEPPASIGEYHIIFFPCDSILSLDPYSIDALVCLWCDITWHEHIGWIILIGVDMHVMWCYLMLFDVIWCDTCMIGCESPRLVSICMLCDVMWCYLI